MANDYSLDICQYIRSEKFFKISKERKERITKLQMYNMIRRTSRMFEWKGLPETIPQRDLELQIQTRGVTGIINHNDKLYSVYGGLGGKPNYNYMPTWYVVANPYLNLSKTYYIYDEGEHKKDIVIIPNDSLYQGLIPLLSYHCELLTEIQLTKRCIVINNRIPNLLTAPDNNAMRDLQDFLKSLEEGEQSVVYDKNLLKQINSVPVNDGSTRNVMTQVLEMEQYQKAALFNDIGLQMNYNMKRETITSSEAQLGESALLPLPDDMLEMRKNACNQVNELFGEKWEVEFSSAWKDLRKTIQVEMALEEKELNSSEDNVRSIVQEETSNDNSENTVQSVEQEESNYQEAVNIVEPIIEATKEVIENLAGGEENVSKDTETT